MPSIYSAHESSLTKIENFRLTGMLLNQLETWNHSEKHPVLGGLGARSVGFISVSGACVTDVCFHLAMTVATIVTGVFVTPYNLIMKKIDAKYMAPRDLELESAFVHLIRVVESLFQAAVLPLVVVFDPCRAHALVCYQIGSKPVVVEAEPLLERIADIPVPPLPPPPLPLKPQPGPQAQEAIPAAPPLPLSSTPPASGLNSHRADLFAQIKQGTSLRAVEVVKSPSQEGGTLGAVLGQALAARRTAMGGSDDESDGEWSSESSDSDDDSQPINFGNETVGHFGPLQKALKKDNLSE